MAAYLTDRGRYVLAKYDWTAITPRLILVSSAPANQAAANGLDHPDDIVANELSGTGYARVTLGTLAITEDDTNHWAKISAANPATYTALAAGTLVGAWVVRRAGGSDVDATDDLMMFLGCTSLVTNGGDVTVSFDTNGLTTLT